MIDFKKIDQKEWEKFPEPQVQKPPNRWEEVLGLLESGEIVEIPVVAEKLKGTRIGLARSASSLLRSRRVSSVCVTSVVPFTATRALLR